MEGQVTALEPTNHQAVRYKYVVDSNEYTGRGNAGHGNPLFENMRVGQTVLVFYDPANPQLSSLGRPEARLYGNLWVAVMVAIILPTLLVASLYRMGFYH
jgi:hypothetical protein